MLIKGGLSSLSPPPQALSSQPSETRSSSDQRPSRQSLPEAARARRARADGQALSFFLSLSLWCQAYFAPFSLVWRSDDAGAGNSGSRSSSSSSLTFNAYRTHTLIINGRPAQPSSGAGKHAPSCGRFVEGDSASFDHRRRRMRQSLWRWRQQQAACEAVTVHNLYLDTNASFTRRAIRRKESTACNEVGAWVSTAGDLIIELRTSIHRSIPWNNCPLLNTCH